MTPEDVWKAALNAAINDKEIDDQLSSAEVRPFLGLALEIGEAILLTSTKREHMAKAVDMLRTAARKAKR